MTIIPASILEEDLPVALTAEFPPELLELNEPLAQGKDPIFAELQAQADGEDILITGWVKTTLNLQCGRCTEWMPWPVRVEFNHLFSAPHPISLDITPYIREDILLELPLTAACRLGADGRCPVTGQIYQPRPETSNPLANEAVWEALSKIKLKE